MAENTDAPKDTMRNVNTAACEYVADDREIPAGSHGITDEDTARVLIERYLRARLRAVVEAWPGRPVLQLSGGVDSILIATYLAEIAPDALTVTYTQPLDGRDDQDFEAAKAVADLLGFEHLVVAPDAREFDQLLTDTVRALDFPEPWEVIAGVVLRAIDTASRPPAVDNALISGAGADALFMGGTVLKSRTMGEEFVREWDEKLRGNVRRNFTRHRFVPDFYERLIPVPERHIQVWQTHAAVELAQRLHPVLLRGSDLAGDKLLLRRMAVERGVPEEIVFAPKNPMQVSSGGVTGIVDAARRQLAQDYGERTYSDPLREDAEFTAARLYLQRLSEAPECGEIGNK